MNTIGGLPLLILLHATQISDGVELAEEARITCPWLEVRVLDKVGHFMQLEDPKLVNQHIVEWVTGQK